METKRDWSMLGAAIVGVLVFGAGLFVGLSILAAKETPAPAGRATMFELQSEDESILWRMFCPEGFDVGVFDGMVPYPPEPPTPTPENPLDGQTVTCYMIELPTSTAGPIPSETPEPYPPVDTPTMEPYPPLETPTATLPPLPTSTPTFTPPASSTPTEAVDSPTPTCPPCNPTEPATLTPNPTAPTPTNTVSPSDIVRVDHTMVDLYNDIPPEFMEAARSLRMVFSDRSVGVNVNESLDCLTANPWESSPASCRRDYTDMASGTWRVFGAADLPNVPDRIFWTSSGPRYNWTFQDRAGHWSDLTADFINSLAPNAIADGYRVLSYQFSYLNVQGGSNISQFWLDTPSFSDVYDLERFIAQYPNHEFIFWTTSLAREIGTLEAQNFNDTMRAYALTHGHPLFDFADIESHTDLGVPCSNGYEVICQDWTTETTGGHLGSVSGGKIQAAKAFWVLMAQIAGWRP